MSARLKDRIRRWLDRDQREGLIRKFGGIQKCTWCRQWAQTGEGWAFETWDRDPMLDKLSCGVCGGTSLWRWEMGFMYIGPLAPPVPDHGAARFYDIEAARLVGRKKPWPT